jgi:hypothetical protein
MPIRAMQEMVRRQRGTTLLVVLVMLVVITLLGIASIRMSSSSLLVVGNMQARRFVENHALQSIEQVMNSAAPFSSPTANQTFTLPAGLEILYGDRQCTHSAPASGYSAVSTIAPEDNNWEFWIQIDDTFTGAKTRMVQGVRSRQLNGSCSNSPPATRTACWGYWKKDKNGTITNVAGNSQPGCP